MSHFEEIFMAGFAQTFEGEKTAQETPVLDKALANLGLLEEETEEVEMPILKQAMENLGLLEEEEGGEEVIEASSMLEALAIKHGPAVAEEREKLAQMEKEAKPKKVFALGGIPKGKSKLDKAKEALTGASSRVRKFVSKHPGKFKVGAGAAGGLAVGAVAGRATKGEKKDKKKKK